jgi:hypothetical protein
MSQQSEVRVTCAHCKTKAKVKIYSSVDVTLEPKLRTQVIEKKLNSYKCKKCQKESLLSNPFLYQDHQKDFMVQLASDEESAEDQVESAFEVLDGETQQAITTRRVRTYDDLVEKILVLEGNLDDRVVEILKLQIKDQQPELKDFPFQFVAVSKESLRFYALTDKGKGRFDIPREAYKTLSEGLRDLGLPARESEQWRVVDAAFAAETLKRIQSSSEAG